jgi:hypothetical protein
MRYGPVFLLCSDSDRSQRISRWILEWMEGNETPFERMVFVCEDVGLVRRSLREPLLEGDPPALIVLDRHSCEGPAFAAEVADCIPESWVVELVDEHDCLPLRPSILALRTGSRRDEWEAFLQQVLEECVTPQWSQALAADAEH